MSFIHVTGAGAGGIGAERTLFFGPRIPQEVKLMVKHAKNIDKSIFRKLLHMAVLDIEGKEVDSSLFQEIQTEKLTEEILCHIYSGLHSLLRSALRIPPSSLKAEVFKEDLQDLKIPKDFIPDLAMVVCGARRKVLEQKSLDNRPRLPKLDEFRWRVDVGISTSALNRVLEPAVLMEMTLSDGKLQNFEVPMSKFHQLRYDVASVLKEMEDLEKRSILKIGD
ncbi:COMM domain-containing protein 5-like [Lineus longissimus]|uniref:COMM domain-containing protein 5-like n=1 Tax=Lineus longissimus TaxID=88925 RepID=UPI002B4D6C60